MVHAANSCGGKLTDDIVKQLDAARQQARHLPDNGAVRSRMWTNLAEAAAAMRMTHDTERIRTLNEQVAREGEPDDAHDGEAWVPMQKLYSLRVAQVGHGGRNCARRWRTSSRTSHGER